MINEKMMNSMIALSISQFILHVQQNFVWFCKHEVLESLELSDPRDIIELKKSYMEMLTKEEFKNVTYLVMSRKIVYCSSLNKESAELAKETLLEDHWEENGKYYDSKELYIKDHDWRVEEIELII